MIYLTTGANGSFKTCNTLWDVRQQQLKENRPVFYNGFKAGPVIEGFGWKPFDPKKWQDLPDGSICIFDECQNEFPAHEKQVPDYVNAIAQFRRARGFDFWMITPHPMMISVFIRRLVDNPSWHRHNVRVAGSAMISQKKWNVVKPDCEKPGSGDSGEVTMVPARKEVFGWYESATLHTGKKRLPRAVWVLLACALAVPVMGYIAYQRFNPMSGAQAVFAPDKSAPVTGAPGAAGKPRPAAAAARGPEPLTQAEYVAAREPRIDGFPHSAPVYDSLTAPVQAPYPAACIDGTRPGTKKRTCECYTQQGTRLPTPADMCRQIAANGFFIEWHKETTSNGIKSVVAHLDPDQPLPGTGNVTPGAQRADGPKPQAGPSPSTPPPSR